MENEILLLKSAASGDNDAFRAIVEGYQNFVFAVCLNVLKDRQEAENAAQETFIKVYRSLPSYEFKGFKSWLGRIALNTSLDMLRKYMTSKKLEVPFLEEIGEDEGSTEIQPVDEIIIKEDKERLIKICSSLPQIYKQVIEMHYLKDMSYEKIANLEGVSKKTIESRLYRARKIIKEKWEVDGSNEAL